MVEDNAETLSDITDWRRHLHARPELGFKEELTSAFVADRLRDFGLEVTTGWAKTGVVGVLNGRQGTGRVIALRADMDALPMDEHNDFAHASTHRGCMHACGHDGHTAMLLGAARDLAADPDFAGTVVFIFQPAEEGLGGAKVMIDEGVLDRFGVEEVYGLHNWPQLPAGAIGVRSGPVMASCDFFRIRLKGKGGHAAMPHLNNDPVVAAAQLVTALQTLVSRNVAPHEAAVVSVTQIHAGSADNVIPPDAELRGTARAFSPETRDLIERRIGEIAAGIGAGLGMTVDYLYKRSFPPTVNSAAETEYAARAAESVVGPDKVRRFEPPSMTAEDFAFMLEARPGCYIWLGQGTPDGQMLHHPRYDFNDAVIPVGVAWWKALVFDRLKA
jgi:hippurate hydrolase